MKNTKLTVLAIVLIGIFSAGSVMAADTADVDVNAEIISACNVTTVSDITFDPIDPLTATGVISSVTAGTSGSVNVECTEGTTVSFSAPATGTMTGTAATSIDYSTIIPAAGSYTPGASGGTNYPVDATIAQAEYEVAEAAADYTDTFTVTITY